MGFRLQGCHNSDDSRPWWGVSGRTVHAVLEHIEGYNEPPLEYPAPSLSRRSGSSWLPRRMAGSSSSCSSGTPSPLATVKAEPQETSERHRSRDGNLVINEGCHQPSLPAANKFK
ncbi:Homeobox protein KNOX3 [Hordeum vulgare]|nr:Homeobox protein KNOX3 [Hordeum vulgare]